jgi:hypothetical protein
MGRSGLHDELEAMEMTDETRQADPGSGAAALLDRIEDIRADASIAYRTLVRHVNDLALVVLHPTEASMLREAADACLFDDADAGGRTAAACELLARLSEYGRLEAHAASRLCEELIVVDRASRRLAAAAGD